MNATVVDLIVVVLRSLRKSIDACPKVSIWRHQGAPNICGDVLALEVGRLPFILLASLLCPLSSVTLYHLSSGTWALLCPIFPPHALGAWALSHVFQAWIRNVAALCPAGTADQENENAAGKFDSSLVLCFLPYFSIRHIVHIYTMGPRYAFVLRILSPRPTTRHIRQEAHCCPIVFPV